MSTKFSKAAGIRERKSSLPITAFAISAGVLMFLAVSAAGWYWYQSTQMLTVEPAPASELVLSDLMGSIYFSAAPTNDPDRSVIHTYELALSNNENNVTSLFYDYPSYSHSEISDDLLVGMFFYNEEVFDKALQPSLLNLEDNTFAPLPSVADVTDMNVVVSGKNSPYYAYTYFTEALMTTMQEPEPDRLALELIGGNNIAVHALNAPNTEPLLEVFDAINPVFVNDGGNLLYMRFDGIYTFDLTTGEESLLIESPVEPLTILDSFTLADDGMTIMLLLYSENQFLQYQKNETQFSLVNTFTGLDPYGYANPLISPDGSMFAMQRYDHSTGNIEVQSTQFEIEFRSMQDGSVVDEKTITGFAVDSVTIGTWRNF